MHRDCQRAMFKILLVNFPASSCPWGSTFQKSRFSLIPGPPMGFRDEWRSDSTFPHRVAPPGPLLIKLDFHWFPVHQRGSE